MNAIEIMRDALRRVIAIREALEDGDTGHAYQLVDDLEHDIAGNLHTLGDGVLRVGLDDFNHIPAAPDDPGLAA